MQLSFEEAPIKRDYFADLLGDRSNSYEIDTELKIRKILENNTDYTFEFQKNDQKYEYDLVAYKYLLSNGDYEKVCLGYIEVEVSERWQDEYPSFWKTYSFLKRKVFEYDHQRKSWKDDLKPKAKDTIYAIFNKSLTDCVAQKIDIIASTFESVHTDITRSNYNNDMLRRPLSDTDSVIRGIDGFIDLCLLTYRQ